MVPKLPLSNFAKTFVCLFKYFKQGIFIYLFIDKSSGRQNVDIMQDCSLLMSHVEEKRSDWFIKCSRNALNFQIDVKGPVQSGRSRVKLDGPRGFD